MKESVIDNSELSRSFCKKCGAPLFESGVVIDDSFTNAIAGSTLKVTAMTDGKEVMEILCAKCGVKIGKVNT